MTLSIAIPEPSQVIVVEREVEDGWAIEVEVSFTPHFGGPTFSKCVRQPQVGSHPASKFPMVRHALRVIAYADVRRQVEAHRAAVDPTPND